MNNKHTQTLRIRSHLGAIITTMLFVLMLFFALAFQSSASLFDNSIGMMLSRIYQIELLINVPATVNSAQTNKIQSHNLLSQTANNKSMANGVPFVKSHAASVAEGSMEVDASTPVGRLGNPIKVARGTNAPAEINNVRYSGHALDQMQGRGIMPSVVEDTLAIGETSAGYDGATVYQSEQAKVIANADGSIKTVYPYSQ